MLLFGETFTIINSENGWTFIRTDFDQYEGWISTRQCTKLQSEMSTHAVCTGFPFIKATTTDNQSIFILAGSVLPDYQHGKCKINETVYELDLPNIACNKNDLLYVAQQYVNAPYLWGGKSPFGIDCSGFTQVVYRICGIKLPRDAWQQAQTGETLDFRNQAQPGDLAFFDNEEGRITHVGIMMDEDNIIHASGRVRIDKIDNHGIFDAEADDYSHKLRILKRVM